MKLTNVFVLLFTTLFLTSFAFASLPTSNLVSWWKLDEASGNALDSKGSLTGTSSNVIYGNAGIISNSFTSNHSNSSVNFGSSSSLMASSFSVCGWAYPNGSPNESQVLIGRRADSSKYYESSSWLVYRGWGTQLNFVMSNTTAFSFFYAHGTMPDSGWHQWCATFDGSTLTLYIDGVPTGYTGNFLGTLQTASYETLLFSGSGDLTTFDGRLDEVSFWNTALSSTNVSDLYNGGAGITYPFSTCNYSGSGDWLVNLADNCSLTTNTNLGGHKFFTYGTGSLTLNASISSCSEAHLIGQNIHLLGGGFK